MSKNRFLGFDTYQQTPQSFFALFDQLKRNRIITS